MAKRYMSWASLLGMLVLLPSLAYGHAALIQGPCDQIPGSTALRVTFTLVNFSLPAVCDLHMIPEPQPAIPACKVESCGAPAGWSCSTNALGGADWQANSAADCIPTGGLLRYFEVVLPDPSVCCYIVRFTGPQGEVLLEQEECFSCVGVPDAQTTWGTIKALYGE